MCKNRGLFLQFWTLGCSRSRSPYLEKATYEGGALAVTSHGRRQEDQV